MFLSLKTLYRKRTVIWPFYFYTIIRTLSRISIDTKINDIFLLLIFLFLLSKQEFLEFSIQKHVFLLKKDEFFLEK